jgi:hypothetical protein
MLMRCCLCTCGANTDGAMLMRCCLCTCGANTDGAMLMRTLLPQAPFNRVMSWMSYKYRMQGELYWGTNAADRHYTNAR